MYIVKRGRPQVALNIDSTANFEIPDAAHLLIPGSARYAAPHVEGRALEAWFANERYQ